MKSFTKFLAIGSSLLMATVSQAITWADADVILANLSDSGQVSYTGTFNILDAGYNPATMKVTSATASFAFVDDSYRGPDDADEYIDIKLDGSLWKNDIEVDGTIFSFDWVSGNLSGTFLTSLQDGILNYVVTMNNTSGTNDTWLLGAALVAEGSYKSATTPRVPDNGATLGLLGLGLCALAVMRRRVA